MKIVALIAFVLTAVVITRTDGATPAAAAQTGPNTQVRADSKMSEDKEPTVSIGILSISGPHRTRANNIVGLLTVNLSSNPHFVLVDRVELNKILEEQALGKSGNITPETAAKIGQLTGAKILITGREFDADSNGNIVVIANVMGTENGRVFSQNVQGSGLVQLISSLSDKITQIIEQQSSSLLTTSDDTRGNKLNAMIQKFKVRKQPAVRIEINETHSGNSSPDAKVRGNSDYDFGSPKHAGVAGRDTDRRQVAQNELELIFQEAGFTVLDDKSRREPNIVITGDTLTGSESQQNNLFSGHATLEIKAVDRATGKILALDLESGTAMDAEKNTAVDLALKGAADSLAIRLAPILAH